MTIKLKKQIKGATSYQIVVSKNKKFKKTTKVTVKSSKKLLTVKYAKLKLKKGKTYYLKVRAVTKSGGKNTYGKYSAVSKFKA